MGLERLPNGTALELKIHPTCLAGEEGLNSLVALIRTFVQLGGIYLHIDVVDNETLRDAQVHPERYPNLAVRVSGWSARFVTLNKEWQDMIINRTQQYS
jgi:formate C-acetyltransferase